MEECDAPWQIECRNGPLPIEERWHLRFGGRRAYERARARSAIRQLSRTCMAAADPLHFRDLYESQQEWRAYLRALAEA